MSRFTRGDPVVIMRTDVGTATATGRVISYDSVSRRYSVSVDGQKARVLDVEAKDLVARGFNRNDARRVPVEEIQSSPDFSRDVEGDCGPFDESESIDESVFDTFQGEQ